MNIEQALQQALTDLERELQSKKSAFARELGEIDARRTQLIAELDAIGRLPERRRSFVSRIGRDYQCPCCWIVKESESSIQPVASSTDDDHFECRACGYKLLVRSGNR
jgi:hypothetical protein